MRLPGRVAPHCTEPLRSLPAVLKWRFWGSRASFFRPDLCSYRHTLHARLLCANSASLYTQVASDSSGGFWQGSRCYAAVARASSPSAAAAEGPSEAPSDSASSPVSNPAKTAAPDAGWSFPKRLFFFLSAAGLVTGLAVSKSQISSTSGSQATVGRRGQGAEAAWSLIDGPPAPPTGGFFTPVRQWFATLGSQVEALGERTTEFFEDQLDKVFPPSHVPLLPDAADLKLPDNLPTLVVDLDKVILKMEHDRKKGWRVLKRPGADDFFKELIYHYEIVVWSDDAFPVAQDVCAKWGVPIVGALHRDQCKRRRGHYIKDLRRLGRRLERVLLLDHDPAAATLQPENGIMIREFDGNPNDTDLIALTDFLKNAALSHHDDLRDFIANYGGGDVDLVKRWVVQQAEREKKAESRRHLGSRLFGGASSSSSTSGVASSLNRWGHSR